MGLVERAKAGDVDGVRALVAAGASPDAPDPAGELPLVAAAAAHRVEVVQALLALGATPDRADADGTVAVDVALRHRTILEALLAAGADPNRPRDPSLAYAVAGNPRMLAVVLAHGADPNVPTADHETPLTFASDWGYAASVEVLLASGAEVDFLDPESQHTPLAYAARHGHAAVVELLLSAGADARLGGGMALAGALDAGHIGLVERLLAYDSGLPAACTLDPVALAEDRGEAELARRLEALRWSEPVDGLRARLRIVQRPSAPARSLEVLVDLENTGDRPLSVQEGDPTAFTWRLVDGDGQEVPPPVGRMDVLSGPTLRTLQPGETSTRTVSLASEGYELDLVTSCWPSLGEDEPHVGSRMHLSVRFAPEGWPRPLWLPARAIR